MAQSKYATEHVADKSTLYIEPDDVDDQKDIAQKPDYQQLQISPLISVMHVRKHRRSLRTQKVSFIPGQPLQCIIRWSAILQHRTMPCVYVDAPMVINHIIGLNHVLPVPAEHNLKRDPFQPGNLIALKLVSRAFKIKNNVSSYLTDHMIDGFVEKLKNMPISQTQRYKLFQYFDEEANMFNHCDLAKMQIEANIDRDLEQSLKASGYLDQRGRSQMRARISREYAAQRRDWRSVKVGWEVIVKWMCKHAHGTVFVGMIASTPMEPTTIPLCFTGSGWSKFWPTGNHWHRYLEHVPGASVKLYGLSPKTEHRWFIWNEWSEMTGPTALEDFSCKELSMNGGSGPDVFNIGTLPKTELARIVVQMDARSLRHGQITSLQHFWRAQEEEDDKAAKCECAIVCFCEPVD